MILYQQSFFHLDIRVQWFRGWEDLGVPGDFVCGQPQGLSSSPKFTLSHYFLSAICLQNANRNASFGYFLTLLSLQVV